MIGLIIFMYISDNYGRKLSLTIAWGVGSFGAILFIVTNNIWVIFIGYFLIGVGTSPATYIDVVIINEMSVDPHRSKSITFLYIMLGIGSLAIWPCSLVSTDWKYFSIYFVTIPTLLLNIVIFTIYESPK